MQTTSIWLKCLSCKEYSPGVYMTEFAPIVEDEETRILVTTCYPSVPGTTYELLLKGLWPHEGESSMKCLLELRTCEVTTRISKGKVVKGCTQAERLKAEPSGRK